jgi:DNA modification methylase
MTAKEWIKSQIGVWQSDFDDQEFNKVFEFFYEARDIRDKEIHPAVFPINLAKRVIELFTHKGELVLDPFVGIGTTLVAARDLERNAVGFDINQKYLDFAKQRLSQVTLHESYKQLTVLDDARHICEYIEPESVKLVLTSPPYANLLNRPRLNKSRRGDLRDNRQYMKVEQYSQNPQDLGTLKIDDYAEAIREIYSKILPLMKPKAHNVINVPDVWSSEVPRGKRIPIHIYVYHAMVEAGFELRNTIIWNRNNIVNRIGIFGWPSNYITMGTTFEYLLDFWRSPS